MTRRTFAVFATPPLVAGDVYDDTFHQHATAVLEQLQSRLAAAGWSASEPDIHSHYGVALYVKHEALGEMRVLLQCVEMWLLTLTRVRTLWKKIKKVPEDEVDEGFASAVDRALEDMQVTSKRWFTEEQYGEWARTQP
jgi:hypothetical protein